MAEENIKQYSMKQIETMIAKGDYSQTSKDTPEHEIDPGFWENAKIIQPPVKKSVHLKLEAEVLEWFKAQGKGHLTRMQAVLKSYYEAHLHS